MLISRTVIVFLTKRLLKNSAAFFNFVISIFRDVAQPGSALRSGRRGRWFESSHPDTGFLKKPGTFYYNLTLICRYHPVIKTFYLRFAKKSTNEKINWFCACNELLFYCCCPGRFYQEKNC
jgi:hypothetical protein